jgi:hypothetical protein
MADKKHCGSMIDTVEIPAIISSPRQPLVPRRSGYDRFEGRRRPQTRALATWVWAHSLRVKANHRRENDFHA